MPVPTSLRFAVWLLIQRLLRHRYGPRSEKLDLDQLQLVLEDVEQSAAESEAAKDAAEPPERRPRAEVANRNRGVLPAHLPRYEVVIDIGDKQCPCCGSALHMIGEDRTEQLDLVPAQLRVKVVCRPRYGCRACEGAVVQAPAPERPIDGGMATEALVAHIVVSKFCDALPLYRQAQMLKRQGITLDRSTLSVWVGRACWWLTPLYELVLGSVLSSDKVFADETTLPVLEPGRGKTKTGRLWCYAVDDRPWAGSTHPAAAYVYSEDRRGEHPATHLATFRGTLQVDGYAGFSGLVEAREDASIKLAFCWAHTIRTQSTFGDGWPVPWGLSAQRDDMLDLHRIVMDNNAVDHQFEDRLLFTDAGCLQPGGNALTEGDEIGHGLPGP